MGGTLKYAKQFEKKYYTGTDGRQHYELVKIGDGDGEGVSHSVWRGMKELAQCHGMPVEAWPEFMDHELSIDVPLEEVMMRQADFRRYLLAVPPEVYQSNALHHQRMRQLVDLARREYVVFFCRC